MESRPTTAAKPPHPLAAYGDRTVSRIHAKYEARDGRRAMDDLGTTVSKAFGDAVRPYGKSGRPLPPSVVREISRSFVDAFARSDTVLRATDRHRPATRTRPKGECFAHHRVDAVANGATPIVHLQSVHLFASSKEAFLDASYPPFSWTMHAQERLHERTPARVRADVEVADAILDSLGQLSVLCSHRDEATRRMALPCGGGLLLGEYVDIERGTATGTRCVYDRNGLRTQYLGLDDRERSRSSGWRAITFVGPDEIGPSQREFARRWEALAHGFRDLTDLCLRGLCCPSGRDPFHDVGRDAAADATSVPDVTGSIRGLLDLVADPRMRRACGERDGPAPQDDHDTRHAMR